MIIRTRRRNESFRTRIMRSLTKAATSGQLQIMPQSAFEREIAKETDRSNRRIGQREFALLTINFSDYKTPDAVLEKMTRGFISRLRISDSLGWFELQLAVLLPETGKEGAALVAHNLLDIAKIHNVAIVTKISIYPWDDKIAAIAQELHDMESASLSSDNSPSNDDHHGDQGPSLKSSIRFDEARDDGDLTTGSPHFFDGENGHGGAVLSQVDRSFESSVSVCERPAVATEAFTSTAVDARVDPSTSSEAGGTGMELKFQTDQTPLWKRAIDITFASTGLLVLSPVFLGAAAAIKISSRGPVFFKQMREGKDGKPFGILKFRTMIVDAEAAQAALRHQSEQDGPAFKLKDDPRITQVGRYLRKSCIDELPQLLNVVRGQMSLVGPRPLPVGESYQCSVWQRKRLSVLPGITCIWQAHGGRDIAFSEWMRMDMEYIRRRSLFYDLKLIVQTAFMALLQRGSV